MVENCIILVGHITNKNHSIALKRCVDSIRDNSKGYPIILCSTGNIELLQEHIENVDHHIFTSFNTKIKLENDVVEVFYKTSNWKIAYNVIAPDTYGFAQIQKTILGLQGAITLGYKNFLVMNYDTLVLDSGFIDYMFSEKLSIFFKFLGHEVKTQSDVFKLNVDGANVLMKLGDVNIHNTFAKKHGGGMLEDVLGELLVHYNLDYRKFDANSSSMFQLSPFKVIVNNSFNEGAMAAVHNNIVHLLITDQGNPRHTLDGKIEIGHNNNFVTYDVSKPIALLQPLTEYTGDDVEIVVRTSFGETTAIIGKEYLENSKIEFY